MQARKDPPTAFRSGPTDVVIPLQSRRPARTPDSAEHWLDTSNRILARAADPGTPLLERLRHLSVFAGHLDEFCMADIDRLAPPVLHDLVEQRDAILDDVQAALRIEGITVCEWSQLSREEQQRLHSMVRYRVSPVLTPLAVDPAHPFPRVSGLSLNLAVLLHDHDTANARFACVEIPPLLPRFLSLGDLRFVRLEEVVSAYLPDLFPGMDLIERRCFRVTRSGQTDEASPRSGPAVRLEIDAGVSDRLLDLLVRQLDVDRAAIYLTRNPLAIGPGMWTIPSVFPQL